MTDYYSIINQSKNIEAFHRVLIAKAISNHDSITTIAKELHFSRQAIHNEIKRGTIEQMNSNLTMRIVYDPYAAEYKHQASQSYKGRLSIIDDYPELTKIIEEKIMAQKSPQVIAHEISIMYKEHKAKTTICAKTIYNLIENNKLKVTVKDLIYHHNNRHKSKKHEKKLEKPTGGESIDLRPNISDRIEFGHWEIDCVVGKREGKSTCLMTLVERKTRYGITMLIPKKNKKSIVNALKALKRYFGKYFYDIFKSITADNGSEFKDAIGMSLSLKNGKRVKIYYAHAYHSWERGSNENYNRMIRRYFPKGTDFEKVTKQQLRKVIKTINNYPRPSFGFKKASQMFLECLEKITHDRYKAISLIKGL